MNENNAQLVLVPGLGADARLLEPQLAAFAFARALPWVEHRPDDTLTSFASRMAESIADSTDPSRKLIVGGVSFGGMVAYEMARYCDTAAVVLIASCRSGEAIPGRLRLVQKFSGLLPSRLFRVKWIMGPLLARECGAMTSDQRRLLGQMLSDADTRFAKWSSSSILKWRPRTDPPAPVYHIHGTKDRMIPFARVKPDEVIEDGGHLINVTHAERVNEYIGKVIGEAI